MTNERTEAGFKAFVLMPFDPEFDKVYEELIKPALEEVGYDVDRADSILSQQNILKDIVRSIADADIVIADLTTLNPNVFYELGMSHAMQTPTVLLAQSIEEVPFDLKSYRVIPYSVHFDEAPELSRTLREIGEKAMCGKFSFGNPVADFLPQMVGAGPSRPAPGDIEPIQPVQTGLKSEARPEEEEKGLWDFVVDGEQSLKNIVECMHRMTKATEKIGEKLRQRTEVMQKMTQSRQPGMATQVQKLASATALDITEYAKKLEVEQPQLHGAWESFDENTTGMLQATQIRTADDRQGITGFRVAVEEIRSAVATVLQEIKAYRESVDGLKGISRDVNRASRRTARVLDLLISDLEGAYSYCTKVLTLLDERIEKEAQGRK